MNDIFQLLAYLWGIEIMFFILHTSFHFLMLLAYLWGIEIVYCCRWAYAVDMLLAYLWGIEIDGKKWDTRKSWALLAYPWGIEIKDFEWVRLWWVSVISLPMRNWNQGIWLKEASYEPSY